MVSGCLFAHLVCAKVLADDQVADAVGAEYHVILAQVVGLAWAYQTEAVEAVFWEVRPSPALRFCYGKCISIRILPLIGGKGKGGQQGIVQRRMCILYIIL
jgi:hypothetical protein